MGRLATVVLLLSTVGACQVPPLSVMNCIRPQGGACKAPFDRAQYPRQFVMYEFEEVRAVWEQNTRGKLKLRHPEASKYTFDIGDLSIRFDQAEWGRRAIIGNGVVSEEEYVAIPGWLNRHDASARLFAGAWLALWNVELAEPFPQQCAGHLDAKRRKYVLDKPGCVDLAFMVEQVVANTKFHIGYARMQGMNEYITDWAERQRWVWRA